MKNNVSQPLAIRKDGTWYVYGWDIAKNICEVYGQHGYIRNHYVYTPFGEVIKHGEIEQPLEWSSEYKDEEVFLYYYIHRYYNPVTGRWISRDFIQTNNMYDFCKNNSMSNFDYLGLKTKCCYCVGKNRLYRMGENFYCEDNKMKYRKSKKITIYFGHCNGKLPDMAREDETSSYIGMVTCYANDTLDNVDSDRQLQNDRPFGDDLLPKKNSPETLKSEVNAATKQAESMCEKEKTTLLQVRIIIKPTDDDGVKYLNKTLKKYPEIKKTKIVKCKETSCEERNGIMLTNKEKRNYFKK